MDTRSLIALGMVLAVVTVALFKGAMDGAAVKDLMIMLGSGIIGFTVPRGRAPAPQSTVVVSDIPSGTSGSSTTGVQTRSG